MTDMERALLRLAAAVVRAARSTQADYTLAPPSGGPQ
jgi:hypothetical protein